jgi:hypothetical protein
MILPRQGWYCQLHTVLILLSFTGIASKDSSGVRRNDSTSCHLAPAIVVIPERDDTQQHRPDLHSRVRPAPAAGHRNCVCMRVWLHPIITIGLKIFTKNHGVSTEIVLRPRESFHGSESRRRRGPTSQLSQLPAFAAASSQEGQPSSAQRRATCGITDSVTVSHAPRQEWCCHST